MHHVFTAHYPWLLASAQGRHAMQTLITITLKGSTADEQLIGIVWTYIYLGYLLVLYICRLHKTVGVAQ